MDVIPPNPTWAQIEAGMTAAADAAKAADRAEKDARKEAKKQAKDAEKAREDKDIAQNDYDQWAAAVHRKLFNAGHGL